MNMIRSKILPGKSVDMNRESYLVSEMDNSYTVRKLIRYKGSIFLPLITREEINRNLQKIDPKIRSTLSVVHLGAIKILLKSEFQEGIDSPIKMALVDNRINDKKDCILGAARGNLAYQIFMFFVYPKFKFSITYLVAYALTNSHHSIDYKKSEYIEIDDVFSEIGSIEEKQFFNISPLNG
ncbi:hypothetical protein OSB04_020078 [Centaurea solstitialis]|uniref:Uncharacterized protein n=1 Tax=Centaurea solstitialis TaxID=347529 RepID=A0AA38WCY3_9ASTR|nr:hypothetical protein OSB04_020078 [Centaurea solstitialis]